MVFCNNGGQKNEIQVTKEELEAAYLYKFLYFVTWPRKKGPSPETDHISICVVGDDPFKDILSYIEGRTVTTINKKVHIIHFKRPDEIQGIEGCHVIFIALRQKDVIKAVLERIHDMPILTVSDADGFLDAGGIIRLVLHEGRLRWEINMKQARTAGLGISAQLLRNALRVID